MLARRCGGFSVEVGSESRGRLPVELAHHFLGDAHLAGSGGVRQPCEVGQQQGFASTPGELPEGGQDRIGVG